MAAFNGALAPNATLLKGPMTTNLASATIPAPTSNAWYRAAGTTAGARAPVAPTPVTGGKTGVIAPGHEGQWFERIHVIPRTKDLLFVLSDQAFTVEVWNAYRYQSRILTAVNVTDTSIVVATGTLPSTFPPLSSRMFSITALAAGDALIDDTVTWVFTGVPTSGTDVKLTGTRLIVFPVRANLAEPIIERRAFRTDVLEAYDVTEQRRQLKDVVRPSIEYAVAAVDDRTAQQLNALLFGWQHLVFGVPLWQFATPLGAAVNVNDTVITVDTTGVPYEVNGLVLLWRDSFTVEIQTVQAFGAGTVTLASPAKNAWAAAGTYVMPVVSGRLSPSESFDWKALRAGAGRLAFSGEGV